MILRGYHEALIVDRVKYDVMHERLMLPAWNLQLLLYALFVDVDICISWFIQVRLLHIQHICVECASLHNSGNLLEYIWI